MKYTITEGIKIFELALANQTTHNLARGSAFWLEVERTRIVPNRPGESMRNHWKDSSRKGLEQYLSQEVTKEARYCHAFKHIPQLRPSTESHAYAQARARMFEAAAIPVNTLKYKVDNNAEFEAVKTAKKQREQENKDFELAILSRMAKVRPVPEQAQTMGL